MNICRYICVTLPTVAAFSAFASGSAAPPILCDGVLANSGAQGPATVRFAEGEARGMGVVVDKCGTIWDRAGKGRLNRYAPDGRLLASYRIANGAGARDLLTCVGDLLVMLVAGRLYVLPVDAPANSEARPLGVEAECLSFGSAGGRVACATRDAVLLVDPVTGRTEQVLAFSGADQVELAPDGTIFVAADGRMRRFVAGRETGDGWPRRPPGERMQLIDGFWFGHAWHGTIRRYDASMEPAPGVVLGGASGSFIGHLDQNPELSNGRGLARLSDGVFAVSGLGGVVHLAAWDGRKQRMEIIRRIGAAAAGGGLALDRDGRVWWFAGAWLWTDPPDAPIRFGVNAPDPPGIGQAVMLDGQRMLSPACMWGKPAFYRGVLSSEVAVDRIEGPCPLKKGYLASAVYNDAAGKRILLVVDRAGAGQAFLTDAGGAIRGDAGQVTLRTSAPVGECTSLAMKDAATLLAAIDGWVVEFARDGSDWKESRRSNLWGEGPCGSRIWIAADDGRLWISDRQRHRVLCVAMATGEMVGVFGSADRPGDGPESLDSPEQVAACGRRAVVHDRGNQRLVKLRLP